MLTALLAVLALIAFFLMLSALTEPREHRSRRQFRMGLAFVVAASVVALYKPADVQAGLDTVILEKQLWGTTEIACADDDAGTSPACTPTLPRGETVEIACSDANGCTYAVPRPATGQHQKMAGKVQTIVSTGAYAVTIAEVAGTNEQAGSAALGTYDAITYRGINLSVDGGVWGRWVETARSNN